MEENKNEEVLEQTIEQQEESPKKKNSKKNKIDITKGAVIEKSSYKEPNWIKEVKAINPLDMSPLEALNFLYELKKKMEN